jgi:hypothetical protein
MRSPLLSVLVVLALAAGCGGSSNSGPTPADAGHDGINSNGDAGVVDAGPEDAGEPDSGVDAGPIDAGFGPFSVEKWCEMSALATCAQSERCLMLDDAKVGLCRQRAVSACQQAELTAGVAAGRLRYDAQKAADCINDYAKVECSATPDACNAVFEGLGAEDAGCLVAEECQAGTFCYLGGNACPSRCTAYEPVDAGCNFADRQCDPVTANCRFANGLYNCAARQPDGGTCVYWSDCLDGLACINSVCVQEIAKTGEPCSVNQGYPLCGADEFCRLPLGQTNVPGVCTKKAALGGVCSGYGTCLPGLRCSSNYSTGKCVNLGSEGDVCWNYDDCRDELFCDVSTSRCTAFPADGGDCGSQGSFFRCAPGYYCDYTDDHCQKLLGVGEVCTSATYCQSNECLYGTLPDGGSAWQCEEACVLRLDGGTPTP